MKLVSESLSLDDYEQAVELFFERGWTDGLPVVLPTRKRVEALISYAGRDPQESLGPVPPKGGEATIEKLAINAVMVHRAQARLQLARRRLRHGYRSNAAVGRAARLARWNLGGAVPWDTDKSTLSHPGEYAFCIAEGVRVAG
jgi:hypothetical protein